MEKVFTLCVIHQGPKVLLGMKKKGFGQGRWNGFGGKIKDNESINGAARREIKEEVGIEVFNLKERGILKFKFVEKPDEILKVHLFSAEDFKGDLIESEEMKPQWFDINKIPYEQMWPDDQHWLPLLLAGKNFNGWFNFQDESKLIRYYVKEIV